MSIQPPGRILGLLTLLSLPLRLRAAVPFALTWSSKTYGPDGPWNAVSVSIGNPAQSVDLYPGGQWSSVIMLSSMCDNTTFSLDCSADDPRFFDITESKTVGNVTDPKWGKGRFARWGTSQESVMYDTVDLGNGVSVPKVSMRGVWEADQVYPGGDAYPVEVGWLSLGAPAAEHKYGDAAMEFVGSWLYNSGGSKSTPSYSYGMHIGSAASEPSIPGSLLLGGYDQNRVVGDVSVQPFTPWSRSAPGGNLVIDLQDVSLNVITGGSPWTNFTSRDKLLTDDSGSHIPITLEVDPTKPYLYLPRTTCDTIAGYLPVTYDDNYGLYFWDTSDPLYETITTSPAVLSFSFTKDSSTDNDPLTIHVPFALLTLTLEAPLIANPTRYFPCMPAKYPKLGRAFLQAAFIGMNYGIENVHSGNWFLAQAPGPSIPSSSSASIVPIDVEATTLSSTATSFLSTWNSTWTALPILSDGPTYVPGGAPTLQDSGEAGVPSVPETPGGGLSTGAIAGISVGFGLAGLLLLLELVWIFVLRKRKRGNGKNEKPKSAWENEFFYAHIRAKIEAIHSGAVMVSDDMERIERGNRAELAGDRPWRELP